MPAHRDVVAAFARGATKAKGHSVYIDGNVMYSYGRHYPLAIRHPEHETKDWGAGVEYIINTRGYSMSTSRHISYTRQGLSRAVGLCFATLANLGVIGFKDSIPKPEDIQFLVRREGMVAFRDKQGRAFISEGGAIRECLRSELLALRAA